MMDISTIRFICREIGSVKKYTENSKFFGNIELELITKKNNILYIISDRGEYNCFLKKTTKLVPINKLLKRESYSVFESLYELIDVLKKNIKEIDR